MPIPRAIDHLVLAVPDLAVAAETYRGFGFAVGARNRHPWGTVNAIVQLDGSFLELIGLAEDFAAPRPDDPAAPFASAVAAAVRRGGGLALVALGSTDADADAAHFAAAGLGPERRLDFGRSAEGADGRRRDVRFSLAFAGDPSRSEAGVFTCRHHNPENFWNRDAQRHPNGARRLGTVVLVEAEPASATLSVVFGAQPVGPPDALRFETESGRIDVVAPEGVAARLGPAASTRPGRFAGFTVEVEAIDPLRHRLARSGTAYTDVAGALIVPPSDAFGAALAFVAPSHPSTSS